MNTSMEYCSLCGCFGWSSEIPHVCVYTKSQDKTEPAIGNAKQAANAMTVENANGWLTYRLAQVEREQRAAMNRFTQACLIIERAAKEELARALEKLAKAEADLKIAEEQRSASNEELAVALRNNLGLATEGLQKDAELHKLRTNRAQLKLALADAAEWGLYETEYDGKMLNMCHGCDEYQNLGLHAKHCRVPAYHKLATEV